MNEQTSQSSDSSAILHGVDSKTKNIVFNLPKPSYDENMKIQKDADNFEK